MSRNTERWPGSRRAARASQYALEIVLPVVVGFVLAGLLLFAWAPQTDENQSATASLKSAPNQRQNDDQEGADNWSELVSSGTNLHVAKSS